MKCLPRLFYFSLGALCSLIIATFVSEHRLDRLSGQQSQNYGTALARMAAQQAVDATLNHDLVSLQVILQDVAANPSVMLATIHDVESNLLVQAGNAAQARKADAALEDHTAPITLHDSVAGYVTVSVSDPDTHRDLLLGATAFIALLLALICGLAIYEHRATVFVRRERQQPGSASGGSTASCSDVQPTDVQPTDVQPTDVAPTEEVTHIVTARLQVANLPGLKQQLSATLLETTLARLDQLLDDVLALYGGTLQHEEEDGSFVLTFESMESDAEAAFRAACSVHLAARLATQIGPMRPHLAAAITADEALGHALSPPPNGVLLERTLASSTLLHERLILALNEQEEAYFLQGFCQPFAALLERQHEQLKRLLSQ